MNMHAKQVAGPICKNFIIYSINTIIIIYFLLKFLKSLEMHFHFPLGLIRERNTLDTQ